MTCASDELRDSFVVFPMGGPHLADGPTLCTGRCSKRSRRAPAHARGLPAHQGVEEEPLPLGARSQEGRDVSLPQEVFTLKAVKVSPGQPTDISIG